MLHIQRFALASALLVGALSLSPRAARPLLEQSSDHAQLFPTPSEGLIIGKDEGQTLEDLLHDFERVSGERVLYSRESEALLSASRVRLSTPLHVAPADVYSIVQDLLVQNRFVFTNVRREEPRILSIASLDSSNRASMKQFAMFVPEEELAEYAGDSALLIQTVLHLPYMDLRKNSSAMRQLIVDPNTMQIIPVPDSQQAILTGFGRSLQDFAQVLYTLDAGAALGQELRLEEALIQAAERLGLGADEE